MGATLIRNRQGDANCDDLFRTVQIVTVSSVYSTDCDRLFRTVQCGVCMSRANGYLILTLILHPRL